MKAIVCTQYGDPLKVLELKETEMPVLGGNRVLVKVRAASLNMVDLASINGIFLGRLFGTGLFKPKDKHPGTDIAGEVEAVGDAVKRFKPGDEVFGTAPGGCAEFVCAREDRLVLKPGNVSFEEAAAVPVAGITALQALQKGGIDAGKRVVVNGASGGVGTFAIQVARAFGAEVTAVCSTRNLDAARRLGADHVIDYTLEDFTRNGQAYDIILAVNGYHPISHYERSLAPKGACIVVGSSVAQLIQTLLFGRLIAKRSGKRIEFMGVAKLNQRDLEFLGGLLQKKKIKPLIDKSYPLVEAGQAFHYFAAGHARGKVVITV